MQEITTEAKEEALKNFRKDCRERFIIIPLDTTTIKKAKEIIGRFGEKKSIKILDALQLAACILENEEIEFVCADVKLVEIAELEGIEGVNPEAKK